MIRSRVFGLSAVLVAAVVLGVVATHVRTQERNQDNRLTKLSVRRMLLALGYEPRELNNGTYEIKIESDKYKNYVQIGMSGDESNIWFYGYLIEVKNPDQVSARTWLQLMKENSHIGPNFFGFEPKSARLYLYRPVVNHDVSNEKMQAAINDFVTVLRQTSAHYHDDKFLPAN